MLPLQVSRCQPLDYLVLRAEKDPEGILFDSGDESVTNELALLYVRQLAAYLQTLGIKRGDIVALDLPTPIQILFMLATWHETAISSVFSPAISNQKALYPDWLFSTIEYPLTSARNVIHFDGKVMAQVSQINPTSICLSYETENDVLNLLFSSGTTGMPKAIPITFRQNENRAKRRIRIGLSRKFQMTFFDFGSIGGFGTFYSQFVSGDAYIVPGDAKHNYEQVTKHKIKFISSSANRITELLDYIEKEGLNSPRIEAVTIGGSVAPLKVVDRIEKMLSAETHNIYGSTEAGYVSYRPITSEDPFEMGTIFEDVQVEVVDDDDQAVPVGEIGRVRIKSDDQVQGYFNSGDDTQSYFKNGWFYIGDLGRITENRSLFLEGRDSELINFGGGKIDPSKVDQYIVGRFEIVDAAGFSYSDETGVTRFGLAIVSGILDDSIILEDLKLHFGIGSPKIIYRVDAIPRNAQGKIMRSTITQRFNEDSPI